MPKKKRNMSQAEVIKFMQDPATFKKAVEGSMKKRQALIDRVNGKPVDIEELREICWNIMGRRNEKILAAQKTDALVLPYFEADNDATDEILALIDSEANKRVDAVLNELKHEVSKYPVATIRHHDGSVDRCKILMEGQINHFILKRSKS